MRAAVRQIRPEEVDAFAHCVGLGFAYPFSERERARLVGHLDPTRSVAAFDGGEIVGTAMSHLLELSLPGGVVVPAAALAEVVVLPTHRRRGLLREMLGELLGAARRRGEAVAVLLASEGGIYGRFGFGPACFSARYTLARAQATPLGRGGRWPGAIHLVDAEAAREAFPAVFDLARRAQPGEVSRLPPFWDDLLVDEEHPGRDARARFRALYVEDGRVDGYAAYEVVPDPAAPGRIVDLEELCALSATAYAALFDFLVGIDLTNGLRTGPRPVDEPMRWQLADPRALSTIEVVDRTWIRLLDPLSALSARRYGAAGALVIGLEDAAQFEHPPAMLLEVDEDGCALVVATQREPALRLDAAALAACYLGGTRPSVLARAGRCTPSDSAVLATADAMFASPPAPHCATTF